MSTATMLARYAHECINAETLTVVSPRMIGLELVKRCDSVVAVRQGPGEWIGLVSVFDMAQVLLRQVSVRGAGALLGDASCLIDASGHNPWVALPRATAKMRDLMQSVAEHPSRVVFLPTTNTPERIESISITRLAEMFLSFNSSIFGCAPSMNVNSSGLMRRIRGPLMESAGWRQLSLEAACKMWFSSRLSLPELPLYDDQSGALVDVLTENDIALLLREVSPQKQYNSLQQSCFHWLHPVTQEAKESSSPSVVAQSSLRRRRIDTRSLLTIDTKLPVLADRFRDTSLVQKQSIRSDFTSPPAPPHPVARRRRATLVSSNELLPPITASSVSISPDPVSRRKIHLVDPSTCTVWDALVQMTTNRCACLWQVKPETGRVASVLLLADVVQYLARFSLAT